jgi:hypothetical protein
MSRYVLHLIHAHRGHMNSKGCSYVLTIAMICSIVSLLVSTLAIAMCREASRREHAHDRERSNAPFDVDGL